MNKARRKRIDVVIFKLQRQDLLSKFALTACNDLLSEIDSLQSEEQDCFDNLPEGLQYSSRGEAMEEAAEALEEAVDAMDNLIDLINDIDFDEVEDDDFDDSDLDDARDEVIDYLEEARDVC